MGNVFVNLPVPGSPGPGASVDTSLLGTEKTITVGGAGPTTVVAIEHSSDGTNFAELVSFFGTGKKIVEVAAAFMRVQLKQGGAGLNVDVAAPDDGTRTGSLAVPAGNGVGASFDTSLFGTFNTIVVAGTFTGVVIIEASEDGTDWAQCFYFASGGGESKELTAQFLRVRRQGVGLTPGTPIVGVTAVNDKETTGAAGAANFFGDASDGDSVLVGDLTMVRDQFFDNLDTAGFDVNTEGFRLFVRDTLNVRAGSSVQHSGSAGAAGGAAGTGASSGTLGNGAAGGAGATAAGAGGSSVIEAPHPASIAGGAGGLGSSGAGGLGGSATPLVAAQTTPHAIPEALTMFSIGAASVQMNAGAGGGGAGGDGAVFGGGGGGGGGVVMVAARRLVIAVGGVVQALGGAGGSPASGNSGGGGGGTGGAVSIVFAELTEPASTVLVTGGTGGTATGTGVNGVNGAAGTILRYDVNP